MMFGEEALKQWLEVEKLAKHNEATTLIKKYYDFINGLGDLDIREILHEDWTFIPTLSAKNDPIETFTQAIAALRGSILGFRVELIEVISSIELCTARLRLSGIYIGDQLNIETDKVLTLNVVDVHEMKNGKIYHTSHSNDFMTKWSKNLV